ncbi:MAG TPA: hypothetical protein VMP11_13925 [Verrucomicrobiae bacterium]|nr:hypothetical protein [Verrucomicrobiae bacterium]
MTRPTAPEVPFTGKWVCVTGLITTDYRSSPQIPVSDPTQIVVHDAPPVATTNRTAATATNQPASTASAQQARCHGSFLISWQP